MINVGKAAHITAAAPGGPRYDSSLSPEQRRSIENGVWLCGSCADLVDDVPLGCSPAQLRAWKHQAEQTAKLRVGQAAAAENVRDKSFSDEELTILAAASATKTGEILLLSTAQTGDLVGIGAETFYDPEDAAFEAAYLEALDSLLSRHSPRLVRHEGGQLYKLTGSGFKLGRALRGQ